MSGQFFLETAKVGDIVIVQPYSSRDRVASIESMTNRMVVVNGVRYYKKNGMQSGNKMDWQLAKLVEATEERLKVIDEENYRKDLEMKYRNIIQYVFPANQLYMLDTHELEQLLAIFAAAKVRCDKEQAEQLAGIEDLRLDSTGQKQGSLQSILDSVFRP